MTGDRLLNLSERWFRLLLRLYPADFRDDMGLPDDLTGRCDRTTKPPPAARSRPTTVRYFTIA